jgi:hypothetical protein
MNDFNSDGFVFESKRPRSLQDSFQGMYVNEDGVLSWGPNGCSTSVVEGFRCQWSNAEMLDIEIIATNQEGDTLLSE